MPTLMIVLALLAACGSKTDAPQTPLARAKQAFGSKQAVRPSEVAVPGAQIFIATPDPSPADYDGYSALLVPDQGDPLHGPDAVRYAWDNGIRDAAALAPIAAIFVGRSQHAATEADRSRTYVSNRENITNPAIADGKLVFWVVRGSMRPTAEHVTVDLATFERIEPAR